MAKVYKKEISCCGDCPNVERFDADMNDCKECPASEESDYMTDDFIETNIPEFCPLEDV